LVILSPDKLILTFKIFVKMPIIKSAKKQLRQNKKRKARNDHFKALYTEARKAFEKAIKAGDSKLAKSVFVNQKDKDGKTTKA
jgi:ribosomal protein S20